MRHCEWFSTVIGFALIISLRLAVRPVRRMFKFLRERQQFTVHRQTWAIFTLSVTALYFLAVASYLLAVPFALKWYYDAPGLFSTVPGFTLCFRLYLFGLLLGLAFVYHRWGKLSLQEEGETLGS